MGTTKNLGVWTLLCFAAACSSKAVENGDSAAKSALEGLSSETRSYVILFNEDSVTNYDGSIPGFAETRVSASSALSRMAVSGQPHVQMDPNEESVVAYRGFLESRQQSRVDSMRGRLGKIDVNRSYQLVLNGVAVRMSEQTAYQVAQQPDVESVLVDERVFPTTASTAGFIGATEVFDGSATGQPFMGEGMIVGIIDSGINPRHPSFQAQGDDGYVVQPPASVVDGNWRRYFGECANTPGICNDKLIGMYAFLSGNGGRDPIAEAGGVLLSYDTDGHGSHVAATAAGNVVFDAIVSNADGVPGDFAYRQVSGIAPHANIISYKVCAPSCAGSDVAAAVEQAIEDGVDVINHSISTGSGSPWRSIQARAFLSARAAGVFVANSAGNNGPDAGTAEAAGNAPWTAAVAASSHDRAFTPKELNGFAGGSGPLPLPMLGKALTGPFSGPIVYAGDFSNGQDETPERCLVPFPPGTFGGEIVVCERGDIARVAKGQHVRDGGAGGLVLINIPGGAVSVNDDAHVIPSIHLGASDGAALKAWLSQGSGHQASIGGLGEVTSDFNAADVLAPFSSRGPYTGFDFLAPNIAAPGVDIFAAGAELNAAQRAYIAENFSPEDDPTSVGGTWGSIGGTSMSSPHIAGAAAIVKQVHPEWTDAEVLSAMQMTATRSMRKEDGATAADPFDYGLGRVVLDAAVNAPLVMDQSPQGFLAADPASGGDPRLLNLPSMVDGSCPTTCSWTREVSATTDSTWSVSTTTPWLTVSPSSFSLRAGQRQTLSVSANGALAGGGFQFSEVLLVPSTPSLRESHLVAVVRGQGSGGDSGGPREETVEGDIERNQEVRIDPFEVVPGSAFRVQMTGSGDPDLYLRFGSEPTTTAFDCRPFENGPNEVCAVDVPDTVSSVFVMVRGYRAGSYELTASFVSPGGDDGPPPAPENPRQVSETVTGQVGAGEEMLFGPYNVVAATQFSSTMTGTGDPDIYVRIGAAPNTQSWDCRPYQTGPNESCRLNITADNQVYVMVRGFTDATFSVELEYTTR